ncbi:type II toxin-antitoxin system mRNA interferase toxin, RelE/StbE family [Desulfonatronospira sp.]|uniref:type II toxin-antitoxin system RelE/ParE family toxin n=1 Tax=Desulfonatronospira sp. TaxID=1962951 RepID=UPI0025C38061|nr:type II toxin-antitoxin system mRNA interferase toxin, RelE/StbE family [Desulfonatronospira sp.]
MKRLLIRSPSFVRAAKRFFKKRPEYGDDIRKALTLLENDVFHPGLKAHKLQGRLSGSWACCVGYDLRIIFRLGRYEGQEAIFLETMGTHDEVY